MYFAFCNPIFPNLWSNLLLLALVRMRKMHTSSSSSNTINRVNPTTHATMPMISAEVRVAVVGEMALKLTAKRASVVRSKANKQTT